MQRLNVCTQLCFNTVKKNVLRSVFVNNYMVTKARNLRTYKEIPGPSSLPFIGPAFNFLPGGKLAGYKGDKLAERLYKLYGPIVKVAGSFGGYDLVFLYDPKAVEEVVRSEDMMSIRPSLHSLEYFRKRHNKMYDPKRITGIATDQGENWREVRFKVNPIMLQPNTIKLYTNILEEVSNDMVTRMRSVLDKDGRMMTKNLYMEMKLWGLESTGVVALGTRLDCLNPNLPADSPTRRLIQNVHDLFVVSDKLDFSPSIWRFYSTPMFKKAMRIYEEHERLTKYFIDKASKSWQESKKSSNHTVDAEKPVLEKLLEIDVRIAELMASDILLAGIDAISSSVIATLYLLALNPKTQKKLREEVLSKHAGKAYLKACIKETMRMMPVNSGNVRLTTKEYNLLGYEIPEGVLMSFSHQYMSSMEEHYPKPDEYIPERWLADKDDPLYRGNTHPYVMAPFGYGTRMCIGRRIAELEVETMVSKIIQNFDVDWTSDEPIQVAHNVFTYYTEPFYFTFKDL